MPNIVTAAQLAVVALDGLSLEDQEDVWWTVYQCIHDRSTLYGSWSTRMRASWATITQDGTETSALSDALQAVVNLVSELEQAEMQDGIAARALIMRMAKAENAVTLSQLCFLIAHSTDETLMH
ncbi:MAG TPA: hypothetical protein VM639_04865 [Dongiaceae bacterium]|nr:hypothetical protein [Dongiaceae bacterium]